MKTLPFDPTKINYSLRIEKGRAPLSALRLTVIGQSGHRYLFNLHTFSPYFEPEPRHHFSRCGRFIVMRHKTVIDGQNIYSGQYHVFYNGVPVADENYLLRSVIRETAGRKPAAYKQSRGKDDSVNDAMRATARQQA